MKTHRLSVSFLIVFSTINHAGASDESQITDLLVAAPAADNPRNTEGDIVELKDGRLLLIYTRFRGGTGDAAKADLYGMHLTDGGKSWGKPFLVNANDAEQNVMSVSLLRLKSGELMLGYLRKNSDRDCRFVVRRSSDEGATWGPVIPLNDDLIDFLFERNPKFVAECREIRDRTHAGQSQSHEGVKRMLANDRGA
jgi:hypothetical protein